MPETGELISRIRRAGGISQLDLAKRAMIPQPNLSDIERGKRDLTVSTLKNIARALGVSPAALVEDGRHSGKPNPIVLTRQRVERIAGAVFIDRRLDPREREIVRYLRVVCPECRAPRISGRAIEDAWTGLKEALDAAGIKVLLQKVHDAFMRIHEKKAD